MTLRNRIREAEERLNETLRQFCERRRAMTERERVKAYIRDNMHEDPFLLFGVASVNMRNSFNREEIELDVYEFNHGGRVPAYVNRYLDRIN